MKMMSFCIKIIIYYEKILKLSAANKNITRVPIYILFYSQFMCPINECHVTLLGSIFKDSTC